MKVSVFLYALGKLVEQVESFLHTQEQMMATLQDVQREVEETRVAVESQHDVQQSAMTLISGLSAMNASLRDQLAEALANPAGPDPAVLQAIVDSMDLQQTTIEAQKTALGAAIVAGTPAA